MNNITYRLAVVEDYLQLIDLRWGLVAEYDDITNMNKEEFSIEMREFMNNEIGSNYHVFVAEDGSDIISNIYLGTVNRIPSPIKDGKSIGYITNVFTKIEYRNSGIGGKLMDFAIAFAQKLDCEVLFVWPSKDSISYYQRSGFDGNNDIMEKGLK